MVTLYLTKNDVKLSEINPGFPRFKLMPGVTKCHNIILKRHNNSLLEDQALGILMHKIHYNVIK